MMPATGLAALPTFDEDGVLLAVIEACRGSANKLKFDPVRAVFELHAVLPLGVTFPWDFGFLPATRGEDGDPLDVLVLMDEPVPPGTVVPCRLVGVVEANQRKARATRGARAVRNDRLIAVATASHRYADCRTLRDIAPRVLDEIERFFVFYNAQKGVDFRPLARGGMVAARRLLAAGRALHARLGD